MTSDPWNIINVRPWRQYRSHVRNFWRKHSVSKLLVFCQQPCRKTAFMFLLYWDICQKATAYLCVDFSLVKSWLFFLWAPEAGIQFHLCCSADASWTGSEYKFASSPWFWSIFIYFFSVSFLQSQVSLALKWEILFLLVLSLLNLKGLWP